MKKILSLLILTFLLSKAAYARKESSVQIVPYATLNSSRFDVSRTATASFSGLSYGGYALGKFSNERYGLAILGGFESLSLDNAANTSSEFESLEGTVFNIGSRFYALDLYIGLGILYSSMTDTYRGTTNVTTNYTGLGVRLETGVDINLSKVIIFTPRLHYDISNFSPDSAAGTKQRFKNFGISGGLGIEF